MHPVLAALANAYRESAAGTGAGARDFSMDYEKLLHRAGAHDGDARELAEEFLRRCELDSVGKLRVERDRVTGRGRRVRLVRAGGEDWLFPRLGCDSPAACRAALARFLEEAATWAVPAEWQAAWRNWFLRMARQAGDGGPFAPFRPEDPAGNSFLAKALAGILRWSEPTTIRYASSSMLGDSKLLQSLEARLAIPLAAITGDGTLEARGIVPKPRLVAVHGPLRIELPGGPLDLSGLPAPIWLADGNLTAAVGVHSSAVFCLTVENEDVFFELSKFCPDILIVQTSYPGAGTLRLLRALPLSLPILHFGDSDPSGFDILRDLREKTGRAIQPVLMDFRASPGAPPLTEADRVICQRLLAHPAMADVAGPVSAMIAAGNKGDFEQESLPLPNVRDRLRQLEKSNPRSMES